MAESRTGERGFVLIGAIWILVLCGAIAALLLARSMAAGTAAAAEGERLRTRMALEAAVETAIADLLLFGQRSRFAALPTEQAIEIGGRTVRIRATAESGRLDLNHADPKRIERVLAGLGWDSSARDALLARIAAGRAGETPLRDLSELRWLLARRDGGAGDVCAEDMLTVFSGRPEPDAGHMDPGLARLLGEPPAQRSAPPVRIGDAVRIEAQADDGGRLRAVIRTAGLLRRPVQRMAWEFDRGCTAA